MDYSTLLNRLKNASQNGETFTIFINTISDQEDDQVMRTAKNLQSELFIRLRVCEKQKDGVLLSGMIEQL
ncbi:hypothetical protein SAMN05428981_101800 [Bacillus sp. OV194]|uniref:hypothetical protein n=1 Tax=Fictibacillus sp. B-59209 TaxID=3024873 RepID=UPI0008DF3339|nr:hypothetical protein [Fictibacillus sp. B-59209]MED2971314.1 hypothetical protein [Fictibacillus sp. B-59209]SFD53406.1 hypothetical protein SAMN05428981_101800 [Bacillus sp. OV194]